MSHGNATPSSAIAECYFIKLVLAIDRHWHNIAIQCADCFKINENTRVQTSSSMQQNIDHLYKKQLYCVSVQNTRNWR